MTNDDDSELFAKLRELPLHAPDASDAARTQARSRAAFVRAAGGDEATHLRLAAALGRVAMPAFLAGVVGIYLTWAVSAAAALAQ